MGHSNFKKKRILLDFPDNLIILADKLNITKFSVLGGSGGGSYDMVIYIELIMKSNSINILIFIINSQFNWINLEEIT